MNAVFATFGRRLRYARKIRSGLTQEQAANHLIDLGFPVSEKLIGYWETIGEPTHTRGRRIFYPDEMFGLIELYRINGLWLYGYERTPSLSIEPPAVGESAWFGRPIPMSMLDQELNQKIDRLSDSQKRAFIEIINTLSD
jgi:hypothetical protein